MPRTENDQSTLTRLITAYERPIKPNLIRNWLASHPRIVIPILVFLLGTLTYTVRVSNNSHWSVKPYHALEGLRPYTRVGCAGKKYGVA